MPRYDAEDESAGKTWTLVAAAAIVLAIAAVGGWLIFGNDDGDDDDAGASPTGVEASPAPDDYLGPRAIDGGVPVGFAHSAAGSQAAAATWVTYGTLGPYRRLADGIDDVFQPPEVLGTPDPENTTWFSTAPLGVSEGVSGDAGVVTVLTVKTQVDDEGEGVIVSLMSLALTLEWVEGEQDWRITDTSLVDEFLPPLTTEQFEGFKWLGPLSYQVVGPLLPA